MTDALTQAFTDLDTAIAGIVGELQTVSEQLIVAMQNPTGDNTAVIAELQQRTANVIAATQAVQAALSNTAAGTPVSPGTTVGTGQATDVSTAPSTGGDNSAGDTVPTEDPASPAGDANQPATGGSPLG